MIPRARVPLQSLNTLAVPAEAAWFVQIESAAALPEAWAFAEQRALPVLVLGGGSNIVVAGDFSGLVLHLAITGIEAGTTGDTVRLRVGAGENWDALVRHCLARGWYGLENLIAIPGSVGAAPIQNIGAYGVELSAVLESVEGWSPTAGNEILTREQCELRYRDSIFKHRLRGRFVITHVNLTLSRRPRVEMTYPALRQALSDPQAATPEEVARVVDAIRADKLPDPLRQPNVGSFFKNPIVSAEHADRLRERCPELPAWPVEDGRCKLAAGWLVEQAGWKGVRARGIRVHHRQALVLINEERCRGGDILDFAERIRESVRERFDVHLEIEPQIY